MLLPISCHAGSVREARLSCWQGPALPCRLQQSTAQQPNLIGHGWRTDKGTNTRLPEAGRVLSATRSTLQSNSAHTAPAAIAQRRLKLRAFAKPAVGALALLALALLMPSSSQASTAAASGGRSFFDGLLSFVLHLDTHLSEIIARHGAATYGILFAIVFAETGFVLTPFLPGDSLLFAAGAFAALGSLNVTYLLATFFVSAVLGDAVNYAIGNYVGARVIQQGIINKVYIDKTEAYYARHGGKTVVLARFIPIVRTFAPFVAGVGNMAYRAFALYNVAGAAVWTLSFTLAGYFFGNFPFVKHNFTLVVVAIVAVSVLPVLYEIFAARREAAASPQSGKDVGTAMP